MYLPRAAVWIALVLLCIGGGARPARAAVPDSERERITDPDRLQAMGWKRDARNVYAWKTEHLVPKDFGTLARSFETYNGIESFRGLYASFSYADNDEGIYCTAGGTQTNAQTEIRPPNGAMLDRVSWWWLDSDPADSQRMEVWETCLPTQAAGQPVHTLLGTQDTPVGAPGAGFTGIDIGLTADTKNCMYFARVALTLTPNCVGPSLTTYKVRAEWRRQVSPAPALATFPNDVPTGHPLFRFVEALAASGVTGGCGGGTYCPDAPITRGQMAVFLAAALGLQWGGIP
jgi:hypothetical protein